MTAFAPMDERAGIRARAAAGQIAYDDVVQRLVAMKPQPASLFVLDRRVQRQGYPWHVVGIALLIVPLTLWTTFGNPGARLGWAGWLTGAALVAAALFLIVRARPRAVRDDVPLIWIDGMRRVLRVREHPDQREISESPEIEMDDVIEVLYELRSVQLPGGARTSDVEGAGVFLRLVDGTVWPVVPSTLDQETAYRTALGIAHRIGVGVKQVGAGWSSERDVRPDRRPAR